MLLHILALLATFALPKPKQIKKMKKYLNYLSSLLLGCLLFASCNTETNNETITEQTLINAFAYVTNIADGTSIYTGNIGYKVRINYTKATADVTVAGLKLTDGTAFPQFTLADMKVVIDNKGWLVISGENMHPQVSGIASAIGIEKFQMRLYQRYIGSNYSPAFCTTMNIDHKYTIASSYLNQYCFGTTVSTPAKGDAFETKSTEYTFTFNIETRCVSIKMNNAQFIEKMPAMNIELKNIPFTIQGDKAVFSIANIHPEQAGTPWAGFPITDLSGTVDFGNGFDLGFTCTPAPMGGQVYKVTVADGGFMPAEVSE